VNDVLLSGWTKGAGDSIAVYTHKEKLYQFYKYVLREYNKEARVVAHEYLVPNCCSAVMISFKQ